MGEKIKCPYCTELIDNSDEKCPYCAEEINSKNNDLENTKIKNEDIKKEQVISNKNNTIFDLAEKFSNHMDFLGYKKDGYYDNLADDGRIRVIFTHEKNPNLTINIFKSNIIILTSTYTLGKHYEEEKNNIFYKTINEINSQAFITKWYKGNFENGEDSINIEIRINGYNKNDFINDLDLMLEEINSYLSRISDLLD
ncbi:MAG: hypothetical protein PHE25_01785 [Candidatus Gracilibacteria bacterium]|nr:hypothetical protein [Candidatus Gracilibacteria bacterium]